MNLKKSKRYFSFMCLIATIVSLQAQERIPLYSTDIPNSKSLHTTAVVEEMSQGMYRKSTVPMMEVYLPEKEKATGAAVLICPGGAYGVIVYQGEGQSTAKRFAENGIAAFVLKYRLPSDEYMANKAIGPLQDAQQAIKLIRENATKWGVDPQKVGVAGFSAGGHLASSLATHYDKSYINNSNNTNLRPDFQILVYPVISMKKELTHADSRKNLLGTQPSEELVNDFSNETRIVANAPQAYITHTADDQVVDVDNSILYFEALRKNRVPVEMHIYPKGGHGFIFSRPNWMVSLMEWMKASKIVQ
jgi:acetyl esterase/lipase